MKLKNRSKAKARKIIAGSWSRKAHRRVKRDYEDEVKFKRDKNKLL